MTATPPPAPTSRQRCARGDCGKDAGHPVHAYPLNISGIPSTHQFVARP